MLLNRIEKALMNNPVRAAVQRSVEAKRLLEMGGRMSGGRALEVGCGRGVGAQVILEQFGAEKVDAFDLDPSMVELARRRLARFGDRARVFVGDAARIDAADATYDAVFDFGIIHHIPAWREAMGEIFRVLKPGGKLYAEEVLRAFLAAPLMRRLFEHPREDRFDHAEFRAELERRGFRLLASRELAGLFGWYVAERPRPS
ncbi:MAG: class I SAM-dependent methyltransferase [Myxococcales bacterium]|nr:class I SAM-dependent methyltransferase [Myxococcales bacterium]